VPFIPLDEIVGKAGTAPPAQTVRVVPKVNVGVTFELTVTVNVIGVAQGPGLGVNVYTSEFRLSTTAGLHVPAMPLVEGVGKAGTMPPEQMVRVVPKANVGIIFGVTVTVNVIGMAQGPGSGVNV
jgi:hypothetical protein